MSSSYPANKNLHRGFLRSRELRELARPLAVLLAILFSLTVHINAALAAGGDSSICAASRVFNNSDNFETGIKTQIEHCGLCLVSGQYKSFGLTDDEGLLFTSIRTALVPSKQDSEADHNRSDRHRIRAPPLS